MFVWLVKKNGGVVSRRTAPYGVRPSTKYFGNSVKNRNSEVIIFKAIYKDASDIGQRFKCESGGKKI